MNCKETSASFSTHPWPWQNSNLLLTPTKSNPWPSAKGCKLLVSAYPIFWEPLVLPQRRKATAMLQCYAVLLRMLTTPGEWPEGLFHLCPKTSHGRLAALWPTAQTGSDKKARKEIRQATDYYDQLHKSETDAGTYPNHMLLWFAMACEVDNEDFSASVVPSSLKAGLGNRLLDIWHSLTHPTQGLHAKGIVGVRWSRHMQHFCSVLVRIFPIVLCFSDRCAFLCVSLIFEFDMIFSMLRSPCMTIMTMAHGSHIPSVSESPWWCDPTLHRAWPQLQPGSHCRCHAAAFSEPKWCHWCHSTDCTDSTSKCFRTKLSR